MTWLIDDQVDNFSLYHASLGAERPNFILLVKEPQFHGLFLSSRLNCIIPVIVGQLSYTELLTVKRI